MLETFEKGRIIKSATDWRTVIFGLTIYNSKVSNRKTLCVKSNRQSVARKVS